MGEIHLHIFGRLSGMRIRIVEPSCMCYRLGHEIIRYGGSTDLAEQQIWQLYRLQRAIEWQNGIVQPIVWVGMGKYQYGCTLPLVQDHIHCFLSGIGDDGDVQDEACALQPTGRHGASNDPKVLDDALRAVNTLARA